MRKIILITLLSLLLFNFQAKAQWTVWDPSNFTQSIVNSTKEIVQTSSTAQNMIKNFQETVKIYQQSKEYYDKLKSVHNLIKDARKVQRTILMVGEISDIYIVNFQKMLSDPNFSYEELNAIAHGYTKLLEESAATLMEIKDVVNINGLSMTDKERIDIIEKTYIEMLNLKNLTQYYTNKNIGVTWLRAKKKQDLDRVMALYGDPIDKYW